MDELERELRRVLRDDRLRVDPAPDALDRVHEGAARRRRRRRTAVGGMSGLSVVAVAALALTTTPVLDQQSDENAAGSSGTQNPEKASEPTAVAPSPLESGRQSSPGPKDDDKAGGPVPTGFAATSVTAMSPSSFWVLGTAPCQNPTCTSLAHTSDGGRTFRGMPAPEAPVAENRPTNRTVTDVRFASNDDGYAYGGSLWSTHDGGDTWTERDLPGRVLRLEAERGTAWAVVQQGDTYRLYRSATSQDTWRRVRLPVALDSVAPDLALQSGAVTVTGTSGRRAVSVVSTGSSSFTASDRPCESALDAQVSAIGSALWMFCATGTQGRAYVSSTSGRTWSTVDAAPPGGWANSTVVGARGASSAVLGSGGLLYRIDTGGQVDQAKARTAGGEAFRYVGFTTPNVGYAVLAPTRASSLLRTEDGGRTWSVVRYS